MYFVTRLPPAGVGQVRQVRPFVQSPHFTNDSVAYGEARVNAPGGPGGQPDNSPMTSMTAQSPRLLTPHEAAYLLRVSTRTIHRRAASGELRGVRVGIGSKAPLRIPRDALPALLRDAAEVAQAA